MFRSYGRFVLVFFCVFLLSIFSVSSKKVFFFKKLFCGSIRSCSPGGYRGFSRQLKVFGNYISDRKDLKIISCR